MDCPNATHIFRASIGRCLGFETYKQIMVRMNNDASLVNDVDFQKKFDGYYKIRKNAEWRRTYYELFEHIRNDNDPTFEYIIRKLYECGTVEPSFSSKMLATINPNKPIWDSNVLRNLGKTLYGRTPEERLENAIQIYRDIESEIGDFINSQRGENYINEFNMMFPEYTDFNPYKKVDFYLWSRQPEDEI